MQASCLYLAYSVNGWTMLFDERNSLINQDNHAKLSFMQHIFQITEVFFLEM